MIPQQVISAIIPTSGREELLTETIPSYCSQVGIAEIIIVNDSPVPFAESLKSNLATICSTPIRIIDHPRNLGSCAARNSGITAAKSQFLLIGEDDVILHEDYTKILFEEHERLGAEIISGVVYRLLGDESIEQAKHRARINPRPAMDFKTMRQRPDVQLEETTEILFTHALVFMERRLALSILFDTNYGGPSFMREDNEFCLAAKRRGARVFICPRAEAYHLPRIQTCGGGCRRGLPFSTFALSMAVNNCLFVDSYFDLFKESGYLGSAKALKMRLIWIDVRNLAHRRLEARSLLYRRLLRIYRRIHRRKKPV